MLLVVAILVEGLVATETLLLDHGGSSSQISPIHFRNATASIVHAGLLPQSGRRFFTIMDMSGLSLESIRLVVHGHIPAFVDGNGNVKMDTVVIPSHSRIDTLYHTSGMESSIVLKSSHLNDMIYGDIEGTLLSAGVIEMEEVVDCSFTNFSRPSMTSPTMTTLAEECQMTHTTMLDIEDTFYNYILTGLSDYTLGGFHSTNSLFITCYRTHDPSHSLPTFTLISILANADYTSQVYSTQRSVSSSSTFTNCNFTRCSTSSMGGGIYVDFSSYSLSVSGCYFKDCTCTNTNASYGGGAIGLDYTKNTVSIRDSTFNGCNCTGGYGWGIAWYFSSTSYPSEGTYFSGLMFCNNDASYGRDPCYSSSSVDVTSNY